MAAVIASASCSVQVTSLKNPPFSLPWGSSVFVKVVAFNIYGDSLTSDVGNGAVIITYADPPVSLIETIAQRAPTSITFSWLLGSKNGGSAVTDFRISHDGAIGIYSYIASSITTTSYTATGLTSGLTYRFKVEAQNGFGYSAFSDEV